MEADIKSKMLRRLLIGAVLYSITLSIYEFTDIITFNYISGACGVLTVISIIPLVIGFD